MRFLLVGDHRYPFYEEAFSSALSGLGHDVEAFRISRYFDSAAGKLQARIPGWSAAALRANAALLRTARQLRPEVILFWRATHVAPAIYRKLRDATGAFLVAYNNDDPFGQTRAGAGAGWRRRAQWRWYLESLPLVDLALVYRPVNRAEALAAGAPRAEVLMPYFIPERDRPVDLTASERQRFASDVTFAGHYEADGRVEHLAALARAGLHLRLFGGRYWTREVLGDLAGDLHPVEEAAGDDYTKALCGAKMSLCFLSRLNRDSYTRRCFEIPACGSLLLSERTAELRKLFREDEEAVFFSSPEELVEKALWLKADPEARDRIAAAGRRRVLADGHAVQDRAREFLGMLGEAASREPSVGAA